MVGDAKLEQVTKKRAGHLMTVSYCDAGCHVIGGRDSCPHDVGCHKTYCNLLSTHRPIQYRVGICIKA